MPSVDTNQDQRELTRKQRREQARVQRRALEAGQLAAARRRARLTQLAIVLAVVVVGIVIVLVASGGSAPRKVAPESAEARRLDGEITKLLAGIPQSANALGSPSAPVTLQYYGDLECPVCRAFTVNALPSIIGRWVRAGKLRIEYHSLETATREPEVFKAQQLAALAAGGQNRLWNFVETFYHEQGEEDSGYVTERFIQGIAKQVPGLDLTRWTSDRADTTLEAQLGSDARQAADAGLNGTPAFLIGRTGGAMKQLQPASFTETGSFDEAIERLA